MSWIPPSRVGHIVPRDRTWLGARRRELLWLTTLVAAILAGVVFVSRAKSGLTLFEFGDETEQFVIGRMLAHGRHIYRDIFSHHGPVPYMLAQLYSTWINESDFTSIRVSEVFLAIASTLSIAFSAALSTKVARVWASTLYLLFLSAVWNLEGLNTITYYPLSGWFFVIVIAQCALPLMFGVCPSKAGLVLAGIAASMLCFCAYSNGPGVLLLVSATAPPWLSGTTRAQRGSIILPFSVGLLLTTLLMVSWLYAFGDLKGFLIYHFYFNQKIYAPYIGFHATDFLKNFLISFDAAALIHSLSVILFLSGIYFLANVHRTIHPRQTARCRGLTLLLFSLGVLFTNPRGDALYFDAPFVVSAFCLFSVASALKFDQELLSARHGSMVHLIAPLSAVALSFLLGPFTVTVFGVPQRDFAKFQGTMKPGQEPIYSFIRSITRPTGDILVLSYGAVIYLKTNRLPASGNLFYLPWQADYDRSPIGDYRLDICGDIAHQRPRVIWMLNRRILGRSIDEYEPCVLSLVTQNYRPLTFDGPWLIRSDIFDEVIGRAPKEVPPGLNLEPNTPPILALSNRLSAFTPVKLIIDPNHLDRHVPLAKVGILLSTNGGMNTGVGELYLSTQNGTKAALRFNLLTLADNSYNYFVVEPGEYIDGEIRAVVGGGISAWESHFRGKYTCIIYEYIDGSRRYSPTCPVM